MILAARMVIPSPLLPCLMATTTGRPFTIWLRRPPLPTWNDAFLDGGAVGGRAGRHRGIVLVVRQEGVRLTG